MDEITTEAHELIDKARASGQTNEEIRTFVQEKLTRLKEMETLSKQGGALAEAMGDMVIGMRADGSIPTFEKVLELLLDEDDGMVFSAKFEFSDSLKEELSDEHLHALVNDTETESPPPPAPIEVHIIGTEPDIAILKTLADKNYEVTTHRPLFHAIEAGHITIEAARYLSEDPACKAICLAPNSRFIKDFETYLGAHSRANGYKVKLTSQFSDETVTDWPSITANELIAVLKTALEDRCGDYSPLNGTLPQMDDLKMEIRGHGVALFVITTPEGKIEPYELKVELRKLNE